MKPSAWLVPSAVVTCAVMVTVCNVASAQYPPAGPVAPHGGPRRGGAPTSARDVDTPRPRFGAGIVAGGGTAYVDHERKHGGFGLSARAGLQLNDWLAVYAQPHVLLWVHRIGAHGGAAGVHGVVDLTLLDRIFVAAGGGYNGVWGNFSWSGHRIGDLSGPGVLARVGGHPFVFKGGRWGIRHGLSVGVDVHVYVAPEGLITAGLGTVGYEMF